MGDERSVAATKPRQMLFLLLAEALTSTAGLLARPFPICFARIGTENPHT
jgi:hypothetical protein